MVAALTNHETVFTVLASSARSRAQRALALQATACLTIAGVVVIETPQWWSVAALSLALGLHAAWGLLVRRSVGRSSQAAMFLRRAAEVMAAAGTSLAVVGIVGLGLALFAGHGRSPYDACGPGAQSAYCQALQHPRPVTRIP